MQNRHPVIVQRDFTPYPKLQKALQKTISKSHKQIGYSWIAITRTWKLVLTNGKAGPAAKLKPFNMVLCRTALHEPFVLFIASASAVIVESDAFALEAGDWSVLGSGSSPAVAEPSPFLDLTTQSTPKRFFLKINIIDKNTWNQSQNKGLTSGGRGARFVKPIWPGTTGVGPGSCAPIVFSCRGVIQEEDPLSICMGLPAGFPNSVLKCEPPICKEQTSVSMNIVKPNIPAQSYQSLTKVVEGTI